jgi:Flp pilus assembly secretin CpaC
LASTTNHSDFALAWTLGGGVYVPVASRLPDVLLDISVQYFHGEVTLEGSVSDRRAKHRAEDLADAVSGVSDVHNHLRKNKGMLQDMSDKLRGNDQREHGHAGSGTKTHPSASRV